MKWRMESLNGKGTQRRLIARDGVHREGERIRKVSPQRTTVNWRLNRTVSALSFTMPLMLSTTSSSLKKYLARVELEVEGLNEEYVNYFSD